MRRSFDENLKVNVIVSAKSGMSLEDICDKCGVSISTAYRYKNTVESSPSITAIANRYRVNYQRLYRALKKAEGVQVKKSCEDHSVNIPEVKEPTYTWKEVVEIIHKKYNIILGD